jgi:O-antigen/teichoic acid export membrane protein
MGRARGPTDRLFEVLRLSAFTAACKAGYVLQNSADALLAALILGPAFATKLVLTARVIETLRTFPERFGSAAQPSLAHLYGQRDHARSNDLTIAFLRSGSLMAALLVGMGVAVNKQAVIVWVGPEPFAGYTVTWMLGVAAWILTVTNLGNHVLLAHGEIERPARAFFAYGIVKFALAAVFARWIGIATFPLAAIAATVLTYSRQVLRLTTTLLGVKGQGYWLYVEYVRPFCVCLSIAVGFWWLQPSFGTRWVAVGLGSVTVLILMLGGVALLARQQTQDLCIAVSQGMAHWGILRRWFAASAKAFANFRTPQSVGRKVP